MPTAAPSITNTTPVPSLRSTQWPANAGNTISNEIVVIRELQEMAWASGERSSGGLFTGDETESNCTHRGNGTKVSR